MDRGTLRELDPAVKVVKLRVADCLRRPIARKIEFALEGAAGIYADPNDLPGMLGSVAHRVGMTELTNMSCAATQRLRNNSRMWARKALEPIPLGELDDLFEWWLQDTHYTVNEKDRLRQLRIDIESRSTDIYSNVKDQHSFFNKVESTMKHKTNRGIMGCHDEIKVVLGPIIKYIEKIVFKKVWCENCHFTKGKTKDELAELLEKIDGDVGQGGVVETDYSSFEGLITPKIQAATEWQVYARLLKNYPKIAALLKRQLMGKHRLRGKLLIVELLGRRMSGDLWTSLGNGLVNVLLFDFLCKEAGIKLLGGVMEGDDGLYWLDDKAFDPDFALKYNLLLKMVPFSRYFYASFCGMCFDPRSKAIMKDPSKALIKFGVTHSALMYSKNEGRRGLLRAKALSLLCETAGCPVLSVLAMKAIEYTNGYETVWDPRDFGGAYWMTEVRRKVKRLYGDGTIVDKAETVISDSARRLMEIKFGWTVDDQLRAEEAIRRFDGRGFITDPFINGRVLDDYPDCVEYNNDYVVTYAKGTPWSDLNLPS